MIRRRNFVSLLVVATVALLAGPATGNAAAPANDNFADAQIVGPGALPISVAASTIDATAEIGEPPIGGNPVSTSVWFKWTAPATGTVVVDLCDSELSGPFGTDTRMAARTGLTLGTLVQVASAYGDCLMRVPVILGTTYNFQVEFQTTGNFTFKLRNFAPPANDNFAAAQVIGPNLPLEIPATTIDSTWEAGQPGGLGSSVSSRSIWFSWTAPSSGRVRLDPCETTFVTGAGNNIGIVYTGPTIGTLVKIAETTSNDCVVDFPAIAGTTYRIAFSGYISGEMNLVLKLKSAPTPANDDFANAQVIGPGLPVNTTGDNDFATEEAGEPNHGGYPDTSRSVWFNWTAEVSGPMRLKTCFPDRHYHTSVYTGATLTTLTEVSDNQYWWSQCSTYFDAVAGSTYRIAVAGDPFQSSHGPFALNLHQVVIPANDSFAAAVDLGSGLDISEQGTTVDATREDDEPSHSNFFWQYGGSVWYRWVAPDDNAVIISACSSGQPNLIAVYGNDPEAEEPGIEALKQLDSDGDSCRDGTFGGRLAIAPVEGETYFLAVVPTESDFESPFTLNIKGPPGIVIPKPPGFNLKKAIAKCRKIKGKGRKASRKRANCIKAARRKAAIIKCRKIEQPARQAKCIRKARKRFA